MFFGVKEILPNSINGTFGRLQGRWNSRETALSEGRGSSYSEISISLFTNYSALTDIVHADRAVLKIEALCFASIAIIDFIEAFILHILVGYECKIQLWHIFS